MARRAGREVAAELLPHLRRARDHRNYQLPLDLDQLSAVARVSS